MTIQNKMQAQNIAKDMQKAIAESNWAELKVLSRQMETYSTERISLSQGNIEQGDFREDNRSISNTYGDK